eukprot:2581928-Alexandrium_andersonii.AAC.1
MGENWRENFAPGTKYPISREWFIYKAHEEVQCNLPRPNSRFPTQPVERPVKQPRVVDTRFPPVPERFPPDPHYLYGPVKTKVLIMGDSQTVCSWADGSSNCTHSLHLALQNDATTRLHE